MNSLPLGNIRFRWFDHLSALRWIGLLYRRPQQFLDALSSCSGGQQFVTAFLLLVHSVPFVFVISFTGYSLGTSLNGSEFQIEYLTYGIAFGMAFGIGFGLFFGSIGEKGVVVAFAIVFGIAFGSVAGIVRRGTIFAPNGGPYHDFKGGIAFGIAFGIAAGIAFGIVNGTYRRRCGGIAGGIAFGVVGGIAGGMALVVVGGVGVWRVYAGLISGMLGAIVPLTVAHAIATRIINGIYRRTPDGIDIGSGIGGGIAGGIALATFFGICCLGAFGIAGGIVGGIAGGIAFVISSTRIYYQLVHPPFVWPRLDGRCYPLHPVAWDDLCSCPFPGLGRLLVDYAEKVPEPGIAEIERLISSYPSQRAMALRARARLLAGQAVKSANLVFLDEIQPRRVAGRQEVSSTNSILSPAEGWLAEAQPYREAKDYAKALPLLQKAADAGNTTAMVNLGSLYQDYDMARDWYRKAADAGDTSGMVKLGWLYQSGWGVSRDYGIAREWYQKAADAGNAIGMVNLGWLYQSGWGVSRDYGVAREWYRKAADAGNAIGMNNLGWLYHNGWGFPQDYGMAREWYQKAADAGDTSAMNNLGWLYENGRAVPQDYGKAREWYQKGADAGNAQAKRALSRLRPSSVSKIKL